MRAASAWNEQHSSVKEKTVGFNATLPVSDIAIEEQQQEPRGVSDEE
jgi:hypothetical protein